MKLGELGGVIFTYIKFLVTVVNYVFSVVISDQSLRIRVFFDRNKTQQFSTTIMMAGTKKYSVILFQQSLRFFRESRKMIFSQMAYRSKMRKNEGWQLQLCLKNNFFQKEPFIQTSNNNFQRPKCVILRFVILTKIVKIKDTLLTIFSKLKTPY